MYVSKEELERLTERVAVLEEEHGSIYKKLHSIFFAGEASLQTLPAEGTNDASSPRMR